MHYNKTKGGVDNADKMTTLYTCAKPTRRWPFRVFMDLIDIAALNAYVIWKNKFPEWKKHDRSNRQKFLRQLSIELASPNVTLRQANSSNLSALVKSGFVMFEKSYNVDESINPEFILTQAKRNRCSFCPRDKDKKSAITCSSCSKYLCRDHRIQKKLIYCKNCFY